MSSESPPASVPAPVKKPRPRARATRATANVWFDVAIVLAFLALTFLLGVFPLKDTDFWWHLRTGDLIRQTGQVPRTDIYTFTAADHPWIDLHWGFQVALSWGYAHGGIVALNLAKCAITCAAMLLLITARRREWPISVIVLAWLPALLLLGGRMYIRPETLTLLYLALDLAIISRWDRVPRLALLLPVVQVFWVNSQGLFVLGPVFIGFAMIDALFRPGSLAPGRKRWWRTIGLATLLTGLACFINPYGIRGAFYPLELARTMSSPLFAQSIAELTPIPLFIQRSAGIRSLPLQLHIATMILGGLSFVLPMLWIVATRIKDALAEAAAENEAGEQGGKARGNANANARKAKPKGKTGTASLAKTGRKATNGGEPAWRLSPLRLLLFFMFSALSWKATRNSHQFAAVVGALTAWNFAEWAAAIELRRRTRPPAPVPPSTTPPPRREPWIPAGMLARLAALGSVVGLFLLVASGRFYAWAGEGRTIGLGEEPLWFPHEAVKFAGRAEMPRRFLGFHDGYAALYEYHNGPERKVFADARLEVMGAELYERYLALRDRIQRDDPAWTRALDALERPVVMTGHAESAAVGVSILSNPGWRCVWFDPMVAVYVHKSRTDVVAAHRVDFAARHFEPDPATDPRGLPALSASAEALWKYATDLQTRGRADLARRIVLLGLDHARRLHQADPAGLDGWKLLGKLEAARDPAATANGAAPSPRYRLAFDPVIDLSTVRATYDFRRALDTAPSDFMSLLLLIKLYGDRGMDEAAEPLLLRLSRLTPINAHQARIIDEAHTQHTQVQGRLGVPPPTSWQNLSELDRSLNDLLAQGRARSAAEFLEGAYPREPRPWDVTDRIATLRLHLGEPARARALWEKAASPPNAAARAARVAVTYLVEGDFEAARRHYRTALAAAPDLFEAAYGLALLEHDDGRAAAALAAARQALDAAPDDLATSAAQAIVTLARPYANMSDEFPPTSDQPQRARPRNREETIVR